MIFCKLNIDKDFKQILINNSNLSGVYKLSGFKSKTSN